MSRLVITSSEKRDRGLRRVMQLTLPAVLLRKRLLPNQSPHDFQFHGGQT